MLLWGARTDVPDGIVAIRVYVDASRFLICFIFNEGCRRYIAPLLLEAQTCHEVVYFHTAIKELR